MNSHKMILFYYLDSFLLGKLSDFSEIIVAKFIDNLSEVRLNLQPLEKLNDNHGYL